MKYRIIGKINIGEHQFNFKIELIPENAEEAQSINNTESMSATEEEKQLVDNYLLFCLGNKYSVINLNWQKGRIFELRVFEN